jgi:uncharacterized protein (TIGR03437 family)
MRFSRSLLIAIAALKVVAAQPQITVTPASYEVNWVRGSTRPEPKQVSLQCGSDCPNAPMSFTIQSISSANRAWLSVTGSSGSIPVGRAGTFTLNYTGADIPAGRYRELLTINIPNAQNTPVRMEAIIVVKSPKLQTSPSMLSLIGQVLDTSKRPSQQLTVAAEAPTTVSITATPSWLSVSPSSARTPATFTVTANIGGLSGTLSGELRVFTSGDSGNFVSVPVNVTACTLNTSSSQLNLSDTGGNVNLTVNTQTGCPWTVTANASWITPLVIGSTGSGTLNLRIAPNSSSVARSAAVNISGRAVTIQQAGAACSTVLSTTSSEMSARGGRLDVQVRPTPSDCAWSIVVQGEWITPSGTIPGRSATTVALAFAENRPDDSRTAFVKSDRTTLEIRQNNPPIFGSSGVLHGASFQPGSIAPGQLVTIFGSRIGPDQLAGLALDQTGAVTNTLRGTRVLFDGVPAPVIFTRHDQTAVIAPYSIAGRGATSVEIEYLGAKSSAITLPVVAARPAIFTANASGSGQIAALNGDGSYNSPERPVPRDGVIILYLTGTGQTDPPGVDGRVPRAVLPKPLLPVRVFLGEIEADVYYAGAAPEIVAGIEQINLHVPRQSPVGPRVPIKILVGQYTSEQDVVIAVK